LDFCGSGFAATGVSADRLLKPHCSKPISQRFESERAGTTVRLPNAQVAMKRPLLSNIVEFIGDAPLFEKLRVFF